jgi:hypothetical protein
MRIFICLLSIISCQFSSAQTWEEWFQQKQTAIKRLEEQIVANKVYIEYAKKGYKIVSSGLNTIRDIKQGDFDLHLGFIDSLKVVNPKIKTLAKVAGIIAMQFHINKTSKQALNAVRESAQFTPDELDFCKNVFDHLLDECLKGIDELVLVITSGELEMTDDDRLSRIDQIYTDMQDKFSFTGSFSNEISTLAIQRLTDQTEIDYSKKINGK